MPESSTLLPSLRIEATSYEALSTTPALPPEPADVSGPAAVPTPPPPPTEGRRGASTPIVRRPSRRVRDLLAEFAARRNEWMELLRGPFSGSGWGGSLFVHALVLTALAFLVISPESAEPRRILTVGTALEGPAGVGDTIADVEVTVPATVSIDATAAIAALGGSTGENNLDVSSLVGTRTAGRGRGTGGGAGDAIGADIAGRVKAAGGAGGNLQISLGWNDRNDLDLHLLTPSGERIYYAKPQSNDGGRLDVDMNVYGESSRPVENITWGGGRPPDGRYLVQVHFFKRMSREPESLFNVRLQVGDDVRVLPAVATEPQQFTNVAVFEVRDGVCTSVEAQVKAVAAVDIPASAADAKRQENRERAAQEALTEAEATANPELRAGKLRSLVRRFAGTEAAETARRRLEGLLEQ